ncbi:MULTISPECIES: hypothetical protein [Actinomycetes]|nr:MULTISPECIES: hypothetical protein [Streptomyces]MYR03735.1 hypothetical protein [Streptomyces sp. SID6139]MYR18533.1 hypothetical protein [Streptomyces sp. SID6137]MYU04333.1 hypothetical protein [Streptomyces sp. SID8366]MYU67797.1 hypothetical protein [Streptomyces sp. SID69]MCE3029269.1 hypothetical protein [Streptomyces sp. CMSTAAHL-2]
MSPHFPPPGSARSAAEVNEQIRALWLRTGGSLSAQERAEYELLVVEWAKAIREEIIKAA